MYIAIDLETHPIGEHEKLPRPVCMSVVCEDGREALYAGVPQITEVVRALLASPHILVGHNAAGFDFPEFAKWCDNGATQNALKHGRLRCTLLWSQLADFAEGVNHSPTGEHHGDGQGYSLAAIMKRKFGVALAKGEDTWRLRYGELEGVPTELYPPEAKKYVMDDSRCALLLAKTLPDVPDVARKTRQFFWLGCSSAKGAYTDKERAKEWRASLESDIALYRPHLEAAGLMRADGSTAQAVIQARIAASGGTSRNAPTERQLTKWRALNDGSPMPLGALKADKDACKRSSDPLVKLYSLYRACQDKLSKEVITVEKGLVHTHYHLVESGRTSSSKPPLQNIGKHSLARRCFRARPGYRYIVTDYGMLELCCMAQLCNVMGCGDTLGAALRGGADVHTMLALQIDPTGDPKAMRRLAKEGNFGRNGGMGAKRLVETAYKRDVIIDLATAKRIIAAHKTQWPEIAGRGGYHDRVSAELERTGGVLESYRSGRLRGGLSFTQGTNTLFQGLGSEVMLDAFVVLSEMDLMPDLEVHDAFHNEVTEDREIKLIGEISEAVGAEWLPCAPPKAKPQEVADWGEAK